MGAAVLAVTFSRQYLFIGVVTGMVYALVAIGIVLVFKASGVINMAHGQFGAFGALVMSTLFVNYDIPYWVTLPLALASGVALAAATELLVIRRLFRQPRLLVFVATVGVTQVIQFLMLRLPSIQSYVLFPTPIDRYWDVLGVRVRGDQLMVLIAVPLITIGLAWLLQKTPFGLRVRASADNPNAASLAGTNIKLVSTGVWALSGFLAAVSALLIAPIQNANAGELADALGPRLLLRALAAALVGRLTSFPLAMVGGIALGVIEIFVQQNMATGADTVVLFMLLVGLVLVRGRSTGRDEAGWAQVPRMRAASFDVMQLPIARWGRRIVPIVALAVAASVPFFVNVQSDNIRYARVLIYMMVAVSTVVLSGWAGQFSLGQFAFVGIGAYGTAYYAHSLPFGVAMVLGVAWGAAIALAMGIPALRVRGLYLSIVTLGFALACSNWVFIQERIIGPGATNPTVQPPKIGPWDLTTNKRAYYHLVLVCLVVVILAVSRLRRTGIGRSFLAVRDNEHAATALTLYPTRVKLIAFALSGGIAAFAGSLWAAGNTSFFLQEFLPTESLYIVAIVVVGGLASISGAIAGTLVVVGIPTVFEDVSELKLFTSALGMLVLLMYFPGGLIQVLNNLRDLLLGWIARTRNLKPKVRERGASVATLSRGVERAASTGAPLVTTDVNVRFGGLLAVRDVSIRVDQGEVVGLIGTNGAGKSTLMNAISGFQACTGGVALFGEAVDSLAAHRRARLGMGRAFQNARLFGALTVRETLMVALEARSGSLLVPSLLAVPPSPRQEKRKRAEADEIITYLGLGRYADTLAGELSTGTRRIVELGALIALDTRLMLLDEPTAGVAQKETEAFGPLIRQIQSELGSSILIIEHDMPMVMSISDRIYCLEAGAVIAEGTPDAVRNHPAVIASYLGTDERAIQRSNASA